MPTKSPVQEQHHLNIAAPKTPPSKQLRLNTSNVEISGGNDVEGTTTGLLSQQQRQHHDHHPAEDRGGGGGGNGCVHSCYDQSALMSPGSSSTLAAKAQSKAAALRRLPIAAMFYIPLGLAWIFVVSVLAVVWAVVTLGQQPELGFHICGSLFGRGLLWLFGVKLRVIGSIGDLKRTRVVVCNHESQIDGIAMAALCPKAALFVAKKEMLYIPVMGLAWWSLGQGLVDRKNKNSARHAMDQLRDKLLADGSRRPRQVIFFPEGTRTLTGRLQKFKLGAFHLAQQLEAPIIPISIKGAFELSPGKSTWHILPGEVTLTIHPEVETAKWKRETLRHEAELMEKRFKQWWSEPRAKEGGIVIDGFFTRKG